MSLDKAAIFAADDIKTLEVNTELEWGENIYVKEMTGAERDQYEGLLLDTKEQGRAKMMELARAKIVTLCACTEDGERLFEDSDIDEVNKKSATVLTRIAKVAMVLNKLEDDQIEDLEGNLDAGHSAGSTSD